MAASFPSSVKSFSTKVDDIDDVEAAHVNDLQDEVVAIETHLVTNYGVFKPLTTPLTSTAWDGDSFSTTSKTKIDLSAVFSVPAGVKAVLVAGTIADSGSATADCSFRLSPNNTANQAPLALKIKGVENSYSQPYSGIVPCDSNGDIYYQIVASGTGTMAIFLQIWGYWV
jgi:hypothetical protein